MKELLPLKIIRVAQRQNWTCVCAPGCKVARQFFLLPALLPLTLKTFRAHMLHGEYHRMILWSCSKVNRAKQPLLEMRGGCCGGRHTAQPHCSWVFGQSAAKAQNICLALVLGRGSSHCLLFAAQFKQWGALSDRGLFWVACISHFWLKDVVHWSHTSVREGVQFTAPPC